MDVKTVVEHNTWHTPEGTYVRLVVVRGCPDGEERLVAEGADLVLYTCEEVPLRDVAAAYRFFERIGLDARLIYGESSRVKVFRVQGDYERIVAAIATSASGSETPGWAQS